VRLLDTSPPGPALKTKSTSVFADFQSKAGVRTEIKGFAPDKMVVCTLVKERAQRSNGKSDVIASRQARWMKAAREWPARLPDDLQYRLHPRLS
jgi:hypothetical protein